MIEKIFSSAIRGLVINFLIGLLTARCSQERFLFVGLPVFEFFAYDFPLKVDVKAEEEEQADEEGDEVTAVLHFRRLNNEQALRFR